MFATEYEALAAGLSRLPEPVQHLRRQLDVPAWTADAPQAAPGLAIEIQGLGKRFGERRVLQDVDLRIEPGEFVAIVGRSGCGKSTLLRLLAGLEAPSDGGIRFDGQPPQRLHDALRLMFQDARLLPWKRVGANVALGLSLRDGNPVQRAQQALQQVGLAERAHDWPALLSGGQRQRVALARALVHAPRLLLLDEPLGALDALTRIEMQQLIEGLWRQQRFTAVLVTHDVAEAVALADRVLLIDDGRIAFDERVRLPRPRSRGDAALAAIEEQVLRRVLGRNAQAGELAVSR
ncbi:MAG: ATP-binding cassette domain-containing protein [Rubrivivax sp.]